MHIYLGYDHNGFNIRDAIIAHVQHLGHHITDLGNAEYEATDDYPDFASSVATKVLSDEGSTGILLCGSGVGICIAANKYKGIRAGLAVTEAQAISARADDDANILCLGARINTQEEILHLIDVYLQTEFQGGRHERRRSKVEAIEEHNFS